MSQEGAEVVHPHPVLEDPPHYGACKPRRPAGCDAERANPTCRRVTRANATSGGEGVSHRPASAGHAAFPLGSGGDAPLASQHLLKRKTCPEQEGTSHLAAGARTGKRRRRQRNSAAHVHPIRPSTLHRTRPRETTLLVRQGQAGDGMLRKRSQRFPRFRLASKTSGEGSIT